MSTEYIHPELGELRPQVRYRGGKTKWVITALSKVSVGHGWKGVDERIFPATDTEEEQITVLDRMAAEGSLEKISTMGEASGSDYSARNTRVSTPAMVRVSLIAPSNLNPRKHFDSEALGELADSIREHGLLEPIVVRPVPEGTFILSKGKLSGVPGYFVTDSRLIVPDPERPGHEKFIGEALRPFSETEADANIPEYEIICGERRWRAAGLAGIEELPVVIREADDQTALEWALVENLVRRDIDPIEEAEGYAKLAEMGYKQSEIAARVNRAQPTIANALRLRSLPDDVKKLVSAGRITASHARALVSYAEASPAVASSLAEKAADGGLTTKELESPIYSTVGDLVKDGLAVYFEWNTPFSMLDCVGKCPAYRTGPHNHKMCLRPECYRGKVKAADAEQKRLAAEHMQNSDVLDLSKMAAGKYFPRPENTPGCREDCEHRRQAADGNRRITVCLITLLSAVAETFMIEELADASLHSQHMPLVEWYVLTVDPEPADLVMITECPECGRLDIQICEECGDDATRGLAYCIHEDCEHEIVVEPGQKIKDISGQVWLWTEEGWAQVDDEEGED